MKPKWVQNDAKNRIENSMFFTNSRGGRGRPPGSQLRYGWPAEGAGGGSQGRVGLG